MMQRENQNQSVVQIIILKTYRISVIKLKNVEQIG